MKKKKSFFSSKSMSIIVIGIVVGAIVGSLIFYSQPTALKHRLGFLIICVGVSTIILDYYINHRYSSESDWRMRANYKMLLWLTAAIILSILVYAAFFVPTPLVERENWVPV